MGAVKIHLKWSIIVTSLLCLWVNLGSTEAAAPKKGKPQREVAAQNAIVGEADDDNEPVEEDGDEAVGAGAIEEVPLKGTKRGLGAKVGPSSDLKNSKKSKKSPIPDEKKAQLMQGFKHAEEFHREWHHKPTKVISSSHANLTKFCKKACTAKNCQDFEVADNCHLICPDATKKNCPDPLKGAAPAQGAEESIIHEDIQSAMNLADEPHAQDPISSAGAFTQKNESEEEG